MRKIILTLFIQLFAFSVFAHEGGHGIPSKTWTLKAYNTTLLADFIKKMDETVYLSDADHNLLTFDISEFSEIDQRYILSKSDWIQSANSTNSFFTIRNWLLVMGLLFILFVIYIRKRKRFSPALGVFALLVFIVACNTQKSTGTVSSIKVPANNLQFLQAVFGAFDNVTTRNDDQYFYIESNGMPNHEMMTGISNWQQQVPINHDYSGENSWAIPMQPQLSKNPLSTKTNFMKGAIAIAINGIPIFNPLNNRGEDANAIGELDQWGGHCGRADDYHYHLPPMHLQDKAGEGKPVAYALDGFPVYGETTEKLDEYLGRFTEDGSYQYHAVKEYPYLIAGMRGIVELNTRTKAPENEISPQAHTRGVRPPLRPLRGAKIVDFTTINPQSHSLTYEVNGEAHLVNYSWDAEGVYHFAFIDPDGGTEESTYKRK
ncbi:YHYH protein [Candidatus Haliotispira prima]|uniref:YHYH protein n=1 Tax=Candidatus Haliotispira prima TaxID=3034016 RepID=A0ABY8MGG1_9SPIO|nr:YHYH protein [Candidatus Haliotispira prima]